MHIHIHMQTHTELQNYDRFSDDIIFTLFGLCDQCVYSIIDERYRNCRANVHTLRFIFINSIVLNNLILHILQR